MELEGEPAVQGRRPCLSASRQPSRLPGVLAGCVQKAFILKQGNDGVPVAEICRKAGISQATYFNWKKKYDGLLPTEMRRLKPP